MKTTVSAQQLAFFTQNGYLELEIPHLPLIPLLHQGEKTPRDLWRKEPELQTFLLRKLGPLVLTLSGKKRLHLGCDQSFFPSLRPKQPQALKEILSIQGLCLAVAFAEHPVIPSRRSTLGILPLPSDSNHLLFFRPELILDWPHVSSDLYIALYALPNAVYIHNPKDPFANFLKPLGYQWGDILKPEHHPLIFP